MEVAPFAPERYLKELLQPSCDIGRCIECMDSVDSTQTTAWNALLSRPVPTFGAIWLAERQSKGRGRTAERSFESGQRGNLYFTIGWSLPRKEYPFDPMALPRAVPVAVARGCEGLRRPLFEPFHPLGRPSNDPQQSVPQTRQKVRSNAA